jgi:hypothetical protein
VAEFLEFLDGISEYSEHYCTLPPVGAKGGEVYIYKNEQKPGS